MTEIKKRKLIFFWTYLEWGGAQVYFMAIMKQAIKTWDIVVVLPRNSSPELLGFLDQIGVGCEFLDFHLDSDPAPTIGRKIQRQWRRIKGEIASFRWLTRYDLPNSVVHIETQPWQSWIFLSFLVLKRANVFVTLHNAPFTPQHWRRLVWMARMHFLSRLSGFHIFTSNLDTKNKIRSLVSEQFWNQIAVTYTAVDKSQIQNVLESGRDIVGARGHHGFRANDFIVLCVGQFIDRKGRWVFLDAAKKVLSGDKNVRFVWLTPSVTSDEDLARIAKYDLGDGFKLVLSESLGSTREAVLEFFRIADVFALPSFIEGLPISLLEAMALGLPSISTNVYAIPEAVIDRETGILIDAGDSRALAREIEHLRKDPSLRERLANKGQARVLATFDEKTSAAIALNKYRECFKNAE